MKKIRADLSAAVRELVNRKFNGSTADAAQHYHVQGITVSRWMKKKYTPQDIHAEQMVIDSEQWPDLRMKFENAVRKKLAQIVFERGSQLVASPESPISPLYLRSRDSLTRLYELASTGDAKAKWKLEATAKFMDAD